MDYSRVQFDNRVKRDAAIDAHPYLTYLFIQ